MQSQQLPSPFLLSGFAEIINIFIAFPDNFRAAPGSRAKLDRNRERDISEQIALGIPAKTSATGEGLFDARYT